MEKANVVKNGGSEGVINSFFCYDVAQGHMNGAPNENRTYSKRFISLSCRQLHNPRRLRCELSNNLQSFCLFVILDHMNGVPNKTRTHA